MGKAKQSKKSKVPGKAKAAAKEAMEERTTAVSTGSAKSAAIKKALKEAQGKSVRGGFWKGVVKDDSLVGTFIHREWGQSKQFKNKQLNVIVDTGEGVVTFSMSAWLGEDFEREYPKVKRGQAIAIVYKGEGTRSGKGRPPKLYTISVA